MNIGTEVFLDSLSTLFNKDHSFMLSALQCLRLSRRVRDQTGAILSGRKIKVSGYRHDDIRYARICMDLHETLWSDTGTTVRHDCSKGSTCYFVKTKKAQLTPIRFVIGEGTLSSSMPFTNDPSLLDLHLLFNMLTGSTTFHTAESWTPLCLPKFNSKGFLHAYICYIAKDISIVMISTDKDRFFDLSEWKSSIVEV